MPLYFILFCYLNGYFVLMMVYYIEGRNYCVEKNADDEEALTFSLSCQFPISNKKEVPTKSLLSQL